MKDMTTKIIALALAIMAHNCLGQPAQAVAKPVTLRRIDPLAMQMQMAILKDQDIQEVQKLLKQGVDIDAPIGCGTYSPLDGAVNRVNLKMLKFLLAHGAKPQGREIVEAAFIKNPKTALSFVKVLLSAGANPNATDNNGSTAISNAAFWGNRDLVVLLLAQPHIKVDVADGGGWTALMCAADGGSLDIEDMLIKSGADPRLKNSWGQTSIDLAEKSIATRKAVKPYVYVSGGVVKTGCYHWVQGMTVLDAIRAAGGFTNFVSGPILISHTDGTCEFWVYSPATTDTTNKPPVLVRDDSIYARIF